MRSIRLLTWLILPSLLASAALAGPRPRPPGPPAPPAAVATPALTANAVLGTWDWFSRVAVTFAADGTVTGSNREVGFWYWIHDQRRVVVIVWNAGWVDTLLLSADAMRLDGANLNGAKVSAVRRVPPVQAQTVYVPEEPPPPPPQQPPHGHHGDHGGPPLRPG